MWARTTLLWIFLALTAVVCLAGRAVAELMTALFPDGVPGYDTDDGVTVQTRLHPELMPLGVREGAFEFLPQLDESVGYTSNALSGPYRRGSWEVVNGAVAGDRVRLVARQLRRAVLGAGHPLPGAAEPEPHRCERRRWAAGWISARTS